MGKRHADVLGPGVMAFIDFAAQAKPVRFESTGVTLSSHPPCWGPRGEVTWTQGRKRWADYIAICWTVS